MDCNEYYCLRKEFSKEDKVEMVDYELVDKLPDGVQTLWSYDIRGQTVSSYNTGTGATLVVFDNVEGEHAYWARDGSDFFLHQDLAKSDAEPIIDIGGNDQER